MYKHRQSGFIVYVVLAILLCVMAFVVSLGTFKRGAVTQLSRNIDQNRLTLLAASANAEVMAIIHSNTNSNPQSRIYKKLREPFKLIAETDQNFQPQTIMLPDFSPEQTIKMAEDSGYKVKIKSQASLTVYRRSKINSMRAYNGTLEIVSKASLKGPSTALMEVKEQREVRLFDLSHTLDKYALFLKNYCADLNDTKHRLIITGIADRKDPHHVSRAYLGVNHYPDCKGEKKIYMDLCAAEYEGYGGHEKLKGCQNLFGDNGELSKNFTGPKSGDFDNPSNPMKFFYQNGCKFSELGVGKNKFYDVEQVKAEYERVISAAAEALGAAKNANLWKMCKDALKGAKVSAAHKMIEDFLKNTKEGERNYKDCDQFQCLINWCAENWEYRFGYTDADSIWNIKLDGRPSKLIENSSRTHDSYPRYAGLSAPSASLVNDPEVASYGPYMAEYRHNNYNKERAKVGCAQDFYDIFSDSPTPLLIEGDVYLRFFKLAYLDQIYEVVNFLVPQKVYMRVIPTVFTLKPGTFLTEETTPDFSSKREYFSDIYMRSQAIDTVPFNALWGEIKCYGKDGENEAYPGIDPQKVISKPFASTYEAKQYGRLIDFKNTTWNYANASEFLNGKAFDGDDANKDFEGDNTRKIFRGRLSENGEHMFVDGPMYIQRGELDLTRVKTYSGRGLIFLGSGNCRLSSLRKKEGKESQSSLRIYLRQGDFIIDKSNEPVVIEASLAALYDPYCDEPANGSGQKGNIILNNNAEVTIKGNLLLDELILHAKDETGLAKNGGRLHIVHDPDIYSPKDTKDQMGPYHISIGPVKTFYAIKSGVADNE